MSLQHKGFEQLSLTAEEITKRAKQYKMRGFKMELQDNYGVENFKVAVKFLGIAWDGVNKALADDGKVSVIEGIQLGISLAPSALGLISAIPQIPQEIIFDQISEEDNASIAAALDDIESMKGDTRDAAKDMIKWLLAGKDIYFKHFGEVPPPGV